LLVMQSAVLARGILSVRLSVTPHVCVCVTYRLVMHALTYG